MEIIKRPFIILWKTYFSLLFIACLIFTFPVFWMLLQNKKNFPLAFKGVKFLLTVVSLLSGVILVVKGKHNFPKGPYIVVSNHQSYFDILLVYALVPDHFSFMGKAELESTPFLKIFFKKGLNISVQRGSVSGARQAYESGAKKIKDGVSLVIFPEATIPYDTPKLLKFKTGAFRLAVQEQVPIVPVTFIKNYKRLSLGGFLKAPAGPGLAPCIVHSPINTIGMAQDDVVSLLDKTFETVRAPLLESNKNEN